MPKASPGACVIGLEHDYIIAYAVGGVVVLTAAAAAMYACIIFAAIYAELDILTPLEKHGLFCPAA